ncbi:MAG: hypothetical protein H6861_03945 [Rhodospirillales bacterium]|nr:hypothetical protein [Rhodospirillales bacterium]
MTLTEEEIKKLRDEAQYRASATWHEQTPPLVVENVIETLEELSDIEIQKYLWAGINNPGEEIGSFEEACCVLFDDSNLGTHLEKGTTGLSEELNASFLELSKTIDQVEVEDASPTEIIEDPQMEKIRELASQMKTLMERYRKT